MLLLRHQLGLSRDAVAEWAQRRVFFYTVDLKGRLFLADVDRRNDATCLKSERFLDFFFQHVCRPSQLDQNRSLSPSRADWSLALTQFGAAFPFCSPCGSELNLVRPDDTPIVFKFLVGGEGEESELVCAAHAKSRVRDRFAPERLFVGEETDRIYYASERWGNCLVESELSARLMREASADGDEWTYAGRRYALPRRRTGLPYHS